MADGDEEFATLGTPFEHLEDDAPRKKPVPIHDQIVTDSRGRRRFHGAFTGGFSAGYFNTVDTKEGWTPKTFVSSRSQKAEEQTVQKPEDFMDEEDIGEFGIAPKRVVTTEKFSTRDENDKFRKRNVDGARHESGGVAAALQDLIVPVKMSVGVTLLTQMGWKEGQGVGPRVRRVSKKIYGCALPSSKEEEEDHDIYASGLLFAPKDVQSIEFASKDNQHGIGYSGINPRTALLNKRDWLGLESSTNTIGIKGQGFGVGALEEDDDDIYAQDNLSNYDIGLTLSSSKKRNDLHGWTGPPQTSQQGGVLSIFSKASLPPPPRNKYPPPRVPRDFNPVHKPQINSTLPQQSTLPQGKPTHEKLTAKQRGEALGEVPLPEPPKSVFDYIAEEDKTRIKDSRQKVAAQNLQNRWSVNKPNSDDRRVPLQAGSGFKPFAKQPDKQARYEVFLSGKKTEGHSTGSDSTMTEWEREREVEEFARASMLYRPLSQAMASRFTTAKDSDSSSSKDSKDLKGESSQRIFGALTRQRFEWHPDKLLCKRFNIPDPYPGSGSSGVPINQKKTSDKDQTDRELKSIEYRPPNEPHDEAHSEPIEKKSALLTGFQAIASRPPPPVLAQEAQTASISTEASIDESQKNETDAVKLAPMDLFKEVFAESSSDSDAENTTSDDDEEEEKSTNKTALDEEKQKAESIEEDGKIGSNDSKSKQALPEQFPSIDKPKTTSQINDVSSSNVFGPALPSSAPDNQVRTPWPPRHEERRKEQKLKPHKKKKKKSKKSKKADIYSDSDSDYKKSKKTRKKSEIKESFSDRTDSEDDHDRKRRNKTKSRHRESNSESSEAESKRRTRKKKEKKSKDEKKHKHKHKEKGGKYRDHSDFNLDDYVEKTAVDFDIISGMEAKKDGGTQEDRVVRSGRGRETRFSKEEDSVNDTQAMNKDILSKLKNIQLLKERQRMRAADFM